MSLRSLVLIVEDDPALRGMLLESLRIAGFRVRTAPDGVSALWQLEHEVPAAIILDLQLPGVNGIDLLEELRKRPDTAALPVIVITGTDWSLPQPVHSVLRKPFSPDAVVARVVRALAGAATE